MATPSKAALDFLHANPASAPQFKAKYGTLPEGFSPPKAPPAAEDYLRQNPDSASAFESKYGYVPTFPAAAPEAVPEATPEADTSFLGKATAGLRSAFPVASTVASAVKESLPSGSELLESAKAGTVQSVAGLRRQSLESDRARQLIGMSPEEQLVAHQAASLTNNPLPYPTFTEADVPFYGTAAARRALQANPEFLAREAKIEEAAAVGREATKESAALREKNPGLIGSSALTAAASLPQSALGLTVGLVTRNPFLAAAAITPGTQGSSYQSYREENLNPARARLAANVDSLIEGLTEILPGEALIKQDKGAVAKLAKFLVAEIPGESIATVTQELNSYLQTQPDNITTQDVIQGLKQGAAQLPETVVSTLMGGGVQSGIASTVQAAGKAMDKHNATRAALASLDDQVRADLETAVVTPALPGAPVVPPSDPVHAAYKERFASALQEASAKKAPQSIALQYAQKQAMNAAEVEASGIAERSLATEESAEDIDVRERYIAAQEEVKAAQEAASDPSIKIDRKEIEAANEALRQATVDYSRSLLRSGKLTPEQKQAAGVALTEATRAAPQAKEQPSATAPAAATTEQTPAAAPAAQPIAAAPQLDALNKIAAGESLDATEFNKLVSAGLAKANTTGKPLLTQAGRRTRTELAAKAEAKPAAAQEIKELTKPAEAAPATAVETAVAAATERAAAELADLNTVASGEKLGGAALTGLVSAGLARINDAGKPLLTPAGKRRIVEAKAKSEVAAKPVEAAKPAAIEKAAAPAKPAKPKLSIKPAPAAAEVKPAVTAEPKTAEAAEADAMVEIADLEAVVGGTATAGQVGRLAERGLAEKKSDGTGKLLPAGRRRMLELRKVPTRSEKAEVREARRSQITVEESDAGFTVVADGKPVATVKDRATADEMVVDLNVQRKTGEAPKKAAKPRGTLKTPSGEPILAGATKEEAEGTGAEFAASVKGTKVEESGGKTYVSAGKSETNSLRARLKDGAYIVESVHVDPSERKGGLGADMYEALLTRGVPVHSDISGVSEDAARVYESLRKRGYEVIKDPEATTNDRGVTMAPGRPAFVVMPKATTAAVVKAGAGKGVSRQVLNEVAADLRRDLGVNLRTVGTIDQLPNYLTQYGAETPNMQGLFYRAPSGETEIWLVGENIRSREEAIEVGIHESIGHEGLRGMLGAQYSDTMRRIRLSFPREVRAAARRNGINWNHKNKQARERLRNLAAEELVAYSTGRTLTAKPNARQLTIWERVVDLIRAAARRIGVLREVSRGDIERMILRTRDFVRRANAANMPAQIEYEGEVAAAAEKGARSMRLDTLELEALVAKQHKKPAAQRTATEDNASGESAASIEAMRRWKLEQATGQFRYLIDRDETIAPLIGVTSVDAVARPGQAIVQRGIGDTPYTILDSGGQNAQAMRGLIARLTDKLDELSNARIAEVIKGTAKEPEAAYSILGSNTGDKDLDSFLNKIGGTKPTLKQRWENFRQDLRDKLSIAIFDQFHGIKRAEYLAGISSADSGYISARLSSNSSELVQAMMDYGYPVWNADVPDVAGGRGLMQVFKPLGDNLNLWLAYVTARRADRLMGQGRENLFDQQEINAALKLGQSHPEFDVVLAEYSRFQDKVLDFAQQAGIIDPAARALWQHADYIPFYRVIQNGNVGQSPSAGTLGKVRNQITQLRGGQENLGDPLENIVRNWLSMIDASLKAHAARTVVDNLNGTGLVQRAPQFEMTQAVVPLSEVKKWMANNPTLTSTLQAVGLDVSKLPPAAFAGLQKMMAVQAPTDEDVISVWRNGKREYWRIDDALLFQSLQGINKAAWGPLMEVFRFPKRLLTATVTSTPQFAVKNIWRDMWSVFVQGTERGPKMPIVPIKDAIVGAIKNMRMTPDAISALAGGGTFTHGYIRAGDTAGSVATVRRALKRGTTTGKILNTPNKLWGFYRDMINAAENANRLAVYNRAIAAGKTRKEAVYDARDLLDFSMRGNNPVVQFLTESVPFLNARLQGLYRLGRGFKSDFAAVAMRGLLLTAASLAVFALNHDDDRYKELTNDQKNNYWHFFDVLEKGDHWQLPKPFEVGTLFGTVPEAILDARITNAGQPDANKQSLELVSHAFANTLSMEPRVQAIWPILELAMNKNTFRGSPILTEGDIGVLPEEQDSPTVSPTYRALAQAMPDVAPEALRSPKQLEHLGRGYVGNMQDYVLLMTDELVRKARGEAAPPARQDDWPGLRDFRKVGPSGHTKYTDAMYDIADEAGKVTKSLKKAQEAGNESRAEELETEKAPMLEAQKDFGKAIKKVSKLRKDQRTIQLDPDMTPEEKRQEIDAIQQEINDTAKDVWDLRPGGKLNPETGAELIGKTAKEQEAILRTAGLKATADLLAKMPNTP